jgi:hypothetical protein
MAKRFSELAIGQTFSDGEFTVMKLRGNDARCVETGHYASFDPDEIVDENDDAPILHDSPTEIERAVITLLLEFGARHPLLEQWIRAMASDPDEFRSLNEFALAEHRDAWEDLTHDGWAIPKGTGWDGSLTDAITDRRAHTLSDPDPVGEWKRANEHDFTTYYLASALREYRYMGRPSGDQSHLIQGMGAPLLRVTTSLAAQLAEYVVSIVNQAYRRGDD